MNPGSKGRARERVLVICALVFWVCFGFRVSGFGVMPEEDAGTCRMRAEAPGPIDREGVVLRYQRSGEFAGTFYRLRAFGRRGGERLILWRHTNFTRIFRVASELQLGPAEVALRG